MKNVFHSFSEMNDVESRQSLVLWLDEVLSELWEQRLLRTLPYSSEVEEEDLGPHQL